MFNKFECHFYELVEKHTHNRTNKRSVIVAEKFNEKKSY